MKEFNAIVGLCTAYSEPIAPCVSGMNVGDTVQVWKSDHRDRGGNTLVYIRLTNGEVIEMSQVFCRQHLCIIK